jgi:hypothetical protein
LALKVASALFADGGAGAGSPEKAVPGTIPGYTDFGVIGYGGDQGRLTAVFAR